MDQILEEKLADGKVPFCNVAVLRAMAPLAPFPPAPAISELAPEVVTS